MPRNKRKKKKYFTGVFNAKLDLHGVRHHEVELKVENFVLLNPPPFQIITGDSHVMKSLVKKVLDKHGFHYEIGDPNNTGYISVLS